jgi:cytidylate kinase
MKRINIAIDGHSSCGKGTLARHLAEQLGYVMIDSGAMYRAVTLAALRAGADIQSEESLAALLPAVDIAFKVNPDNGRSELWLNGVNEEKNIRTMEVAAAVSPVSKHSAVRRFLVDMQRRMGAGKGVVMDGRDIGTVVFPDAELKIFMTASPEIRATRRFRELQQMGVETTFEAVLDNLNNRDQQDSSRADSPLRMAEGARLLDNSSISIAEQSEMALSWAREAMEGNGESTAS